MGLEHIGEDDMQETQYNKSDEPFWNIFMTKHNLLLQDKSTEANIPASFCTVSAFSLSYMNHLQDINKSVTVEC